MKFKVESLEGWCEQSKAQALHDLVLSSNSQVTVEAGVFAGRSLIPMALAHKEKGSGGVIGIDAWKSSVAIEGTNSPENDKYWQQMNFERIYQKLNEAIHQYGVFDQVDLLRIKSETCACLFADNSVDIFHQDSNHNLETIITELERWIPKIKAGGYWIADDTNWREAVEGYAKLPEYGLKLISDYTSWQIWQKI